MQKLTKCRKCEQSVGIEQERCFRCKKKLIPQKKLAFNKNPSKKSYKEIAFFFLFSALVILLIIVI